MNPDLLTKHRLFKRYHTDKHVSQFLPTRWRQKSTGINMEQNCVTVTLCMYIQGECFISMPAVFRRHLVNEMLTAIILKYSLLVS